MNSEGGISGASAGGIDARLSAIVSIAADAIIAIDASQYITLFNNGAEKIFGYTADEAIGQPLQILLPEGLRSRHAEHIREFGASETHARRMGERRAISGRRKSGEIFPAEASISKAMVDGEWMYTVILRDATERRRTGAPGARSRTAICLSRSSKAASSRRCFSSNMASSRCRFSRRSSKLAVHLA